MRYYLGVKQTSLRVISVAIIFTLVLSVVAINTRPSTAVSTLCADGTGLLVNGSSINAVVTSNQPIQLSLHSTNPQASYITEVFFYMNETILLGKGVRDGTYAWNMLWEPGLANVTSGQTVQLTAKIFYNDTTAGGETSCTIINPVSTQIYNPVATSLSVIPNPTQWTGPMGIPFGITTETRVSGTGFDPTHFAIYTWANTIGFITPNNQNAQFSSGATIGTGLVKLRVQYGGATKDVIIPIEVKSTDAPLPPPTNQTTTTLSPTQKTTTPTTTWCYRRKVRRKYVVTGSKTNFKFFNFFWSCAYDASINCRKPF